MTQDPAMWDFNQLPVQRLDMVETGLFQRGAGMSDREILLFAYGALSVVANEVDVASALELIEKHLFPPAVVIKEMAPWVGGGGGGAGSFSGPGGINGESK